MGEYIKREDALGCVLGVFDRQRIKELPSADVTEVKHGKWENIPLNMDPNYFAYKFNLRKKCSICGYAMPKEWPNFNICPNCGAKMTED